MAWFKVTWGYRNSVFGWSETLYAEAANHSDANDDARIYLKTRMRLMGIETICTGIKVSNETLMNDTMVDRKYRIALWDVPVPAPETYEVYKCAVNKDCDMPWTSLLAQFTNAQLQKVGQQFVRGLPDDFFVSPRSFQPNNAYEIAMNQHAAAIRDGWAIKGFEKVAPAARKAITAVTAPGNAPISITAAAHGVQAGDLVYVGKVETDEGMFFGDHIVLAATDLNSFTLRNTQTTEFEYLKGGYVYKKTPTYTPIEGVTWQLPTSRRTGRPFDQSPGRTKRVESIR